MSLLQPIEWNDFKAINWSDPKCRISVYFTVKDAIWLNEWSRLANEVDGLTVDIKLKLFKFFILKADLVRFKVGAPVYTKSCYRPVKYNKLIGGAKSSAHMCLGDAVAWDFWANVDLDQDKDGADCDLIKAVLMPELEKLNLRMEDNGKGANWVHVDDRVTNGNRFFKP